MSADSTGKLKLSQKIAYGLGDIYGGGVFNIVNIFYAIFLTDICGIPTGWAAAIVLVARVWDAVSDPLMGVLSDNTRTKFGRRRPFFMIGAPLILLSFIALWYPATFPDVGLRVAYAMTAYLLLNTVVTLVMVPYTALGAEITLDYTERSSVSAIQLAISLASTMLCVLIPPMILSAFDDIRTGYFVMSLAFGLFFSLPWAGVLLGVKERNDFMQRPKAKLKDAFVSLARTFRVKSFMRLVVLFVTNSVAFDLISMMFNYYMKYNVEKADHLSYVLGLLIVFEIAALPLVTRVAKRFGKMKTMVGGSLAWMAVCISLFFFGPQTPVFMLYAVGALLGIAICFPIVMERSIFGDVTDVGEYKLGMRMEGSFSGVQTFSRKCAAATANALALSLMGAAGYIESEANVLVTQPEAVVTMIRAIIAFAPALFIGVGLLAAIGWPLTPAVHEKLALCLKARRAGKPDPALEAAVEPYEKRL